MDKNEGADIAMADSIGTTEKRQFTQLLSIIISLIAAAISALSAYVALSNYRSQQDAAQLAMADQVVLVASPMSQAQLDELKHQHPADYAYYFPMYVQNFGRLPILGLMINSYVNGHKMASKTIGTLPPCTQVEADDVLREATAKAGNLKNWNVTIQFQDVAGHTWGRGFGDTPWPVANPDHELTLQEGIGIDTKHVDGCTSA